jgi:hypothetical protein
MGSIFSTPAPPPPPPPPPVPTYDDPEIEAARKKLRQSERRRKGRGSTILTGGLGDTGQASVSRPSLNNNLGGN